MNIEYLYWYFKNAVPKNLCDDIVKYGLQQTSENAVVGDASLNGKIRKSNVAWLDDPWIYNEIIPYVHQANKNAGWNYEFSRSEKCQFTIYQPGQFYDWHVDAWIKPYKEVKEASARAAPSIEFVGLMRKLSVTVCLNDFSEYEGGQLELATDERPDVSRKAHDLRNIATKGTIVIFPSFVWHRVKPVTSGTRYSLVIWNDGKSYK
tara:strand:- start:3007 stop:3624 length:618 start_codon:yes stop_codon:yes gene_type:complete